MIQNLKYLLINLFLILLEIILLLLCKKEILSLDYGWDGRYNRSALFYAIIVQLLFQFLIFMMDNKEKQKRLYLAQLVLFAFIAIWLGTEIDIHYKFKR